MPDTASSTVKSAERLLDVLGLLARHTRPVPTMAIARECAIPKSSAHHLLNVMRARNFVTYYEAECAWGLGVAVFEIGSAYLRSEPLQREQIAAIELLCGCQALDCDPGPPGVCAAQPWDAVRELVPVLLEDRPPAHDIASVLPLLRDGVVAAILHGAAVEEIAA
jgi:hypothetical protein